MSIYSSITHSRSTRALLLDLIRTWLIDNYEFVGGPTIEHLSFPVHGYYNKDNHTIYCKMDYHTFIICDVFSPERINIPDSSNDSSWMDNDDAFSIADPDFFDHIGRRMKQGIKEYETSR